jgi:hypothetical protein
VNRRLFRGFPLLLLLAAAAFAIWTWIRPYQWQADPGARFVVEAVEVTRDHADFWVNVHLKRSGEADHDLEKRLVLETRSGGVMDAAETTLAGDARTGVTGIWLRFWLSEEQLRGPLVLRINDGTLLLKSGDGLPALKPSGTRVFTSHRW